MSKKAGVVGRRKHILTDKMKNLAASALAQKIGYLKASDFPDPNLFDVLPTQSYNPSRVIRCNGMLYLVRHGSVHIKHSYYDYFVKEIAPGALFGDMPLLGQTMLWTEAAAGREGATVAVMDSHAAKEWLKSDPLAILERLGPRLTSIEVEHYRTGFQLSDSRVAALLLELAEGSSTIEGLSHEMIGERIGLYHETVTVILDAMKLDHFIEVRRKKITILDKRALRELSEL